jgi:hypothetical protein
MKDIIKISFEHLYIEANNLLLKMVNSPYDQYSKYWEAYLFLLDGCGWSDKEFDIELLRRVDRKPPLLESLF